MKRYAKLLGVLLVILALIMTTSSQVMAAGNVNAPGPWPKAFKFAFGITSFSGTVESQPEEVVPGEWVIAGKKVTVGEWTRFNVLPTSIQPGDYVQVKAFESKDGELIALLIIKLNANEVRFVGVIKEINDSYWVVGEKTVLITAETEIHGGTPDVGDYAGVLAQETEEGLVAEHIVVVDAARTTVHFPGVIRSMDEGSWIIASPRTDRKVIINEETSIEGDQPDVGDRVKVWATVTPEKELIATRIIVRDTPSEVSFKGRIQEMAEDHWIVGRQMVLITPDTVIEGDDPNIGDVAEVWARPTEDGLVANRIVVTSLQQYSVIRGVVEAHDNDIWVIAGQTIKATADTKIIRNPQVGDMVVAVVHTEADGTLIARHITKVPGGDSEGAPPMPTPRPRPGAGKR